MRQLGNTKSPLCFCITRGFEDLYISVGSGASLCEGFENFATICFRVRVQSSSQLTGLPCLCEFTISGLGISEIPNLSGSELLEIVDASFSRQLTSLQGLSRFTCSEVYQYAGV